MATTATASTGDEYRRHATFKSIGSAYPDSTSLGRTEGSTSARVQVLDFTSPALPTPYTDTQRQETRTREDEAGHRGVHR